MSAQRMAECRFKWYSSTELLYQCQNSTKTAACISDKEIDDADAVSVADEIIGRECWGDRELGIVMMTAMQDALLPNNSYAADVVDCIMCLLRYIDTYS